MAAKRRQCRQRSRRIVQEDSEQPDDDHTAVREVVGKQIPRDQVGHYLVVIGDDADERRFELGLEAISIGRDQTRDIVLNDPNVSRLHAQVSLVNGQVQVSDLGSTNGTYINGRRIHPRGRVLDGDVVHVGERRIRYERRSRREVQQALDLNRDLARASSYVLSLFPPPIAEGPVRTDWFFRPSSRLGGDGFGYEWLSPDVFMVFIIDVSGHGVGAAMHTVSVLNVLRRRALPQTDLTDPVQVLAALNAMFQMDSHDGMYFTMWYGVYHKSSQSLRYASAGHHPVYSVSAARAVQPLKTPGLMIGATQDARFRSDVVTLPEGSSLYLFSDGVFEVTTQSGQQWRLHDFLPLLERPLQSGVSEPQRLYENVSEICGKPELEDDFSVVVVTMP